MPAGKHFHQDKSEGFKTIEPHMTAEARNSHDCSPFISMMIGIFWAVRMVSLALSNLTLFQGRHLQSLRARIWNWTKASCSVEFPFNSGRDLLCPTGGCGPAGGMHRKPLGLRAEGKQLLQAPECEAMGHVFNRAVGK